MSESARVSSHASTPSGGELSSGELSAQQRAILEFEEANPGHSRGKEDEIRAQFGHSPARYYQILGNLIESPVALVESPMLVGRLQRLRDRRRARRFRTSRPG